MNKYQKLLGLNDNYTLDDLKMSYRKQVKLNHPDLFKTKKEKIKASRKMLKINEAYQVLLEQLRNTKINSFSGLSNKTKNNSSIDSAYEYQDETSELIEADWLESLPLAPRIKRAQQKLLVFASALCSGALASKCSYVLSSIIITVIAILVTLS